MASIATATNHFVCLCESCECGAAPLYFYSNCGFSYDVESSVRVCDLNAIPASPASSNDKRTEKESESMKLESAPQSQRKNEENTQTVENQLKGSWRRAERHDDNRIYIQSAQ